MGSEWKYRVVACLIFVVLGAFASGCGGSSGSSKEVNWYVFNEPGGGYDAAVANCNKQAAGRYKINYVKLPTDSDQQRELIVRRLAAKDSDIGVIGMDVNWTAEFAEAGWILPWEGANKASAEQDRIPALLAAARYQGKTWVAPFTTNTQLLWYHKDTLGNRPVPKTWDEMIATAKDIGPPKGKIVVQGRRYEGMVVWFNTLVASAGGQILDRAGNIVLGPPAVDAARVMRSVADNAATATIGNDKEDTGNDAFKGGDLAFMVNYPFVYASAKENAPDVFKNIGAAVYPGIDEDRPARAPLGGINIGVSAFSDKQDLAWEAVQCLIKPENQLTIAELGGLPPVREDLYEDPKMEEIYPGFAQQIHDAIETAGPRPSESPAYQDLSLGIQRGVHPVTEIDPQDPQETYDQLKDLVEQAIQREGLL